MPSFVKDTGFTALTRVVSRVFGLLSTVLLARLLGPSGNGYYTLALLFASTAVALLNFGLSPTTIYYIARGKHAHGQILGHLFLFNGFVAGLATLVGWGIVEYLRADLFPQVPHTTLLLAILVIPGIFSFRFFQSAILGLQRFDLYNFGQAFWAFAHFLLLGVAVALLKTGVAGAVVAEAVSWGVGAALFFYWTKKSVPQWSFRFDAALVKGIASYSVQSYLGNILAFFNYRADLFLINIFEGPTAVGVYSIASGLSERLWLVSQTASTVLLPRVSASEDPEWEKRFTPLVTRTVLLIVLPAALVLGGLAHPLVKILYSDAFLGAVRPLQILLIGIVASSLSGILAHDIAGRGYPLLNTYTSALSLVVNVGLNLVLIPRWHIAGAAVASAASYTVLLLAKLIIYRHLSGNSWKEVMLSRKDDWRLYRETIAKILGYVRGLIFTQNNTEEL